ncbi:MAG: hypothetical protein P8Y99_19025 [Calditrichaceae bacterium]
MEEFFNLSRTEIENNMSNEQLRVSQIISLSMVIGVTMFVIIILFSYFQNDTTVISQNVDTSTINILIIVLLIIALIIYSIFNLILKIIFTPQRIKERFSAPYDMYQDKKVTQPVLRLLIFHRIQMIIRMVMLEGVALYGIVILFLCVKDGIIYTNSNYWFLLSPSIIMIAYIAQNFPTKQKVAEQIEEDILKPIRTIN